MSRNSIHCLPLPLLALLLFALTAAACGQLPLDTAPKAATNALSDPTLSPGAAFLFQLEGKFAKETAEGGGKAFASWFADDAVSLSNGHAPVVGHDAIARNATWSPASYQLTWTPVAAQMSAKGDMGFTWGHYEGTSRDAAGKPVIEKGRYMTIWKKQADNTWKVELDSSNSGPPDDPDCCKVP